MLRSCNCRFCSRSSANSDLSCHWWPQLCSPVGHVIPSQHSPAAPKMAVRHHAAPGQEAVAAWGSGCYRTIIARSRLLEDAASIGGNIWRPLISFKDPCGRWLWLSLPSSLHNLTCRTKLTADLILFDSNVTKPIYVDLFGKPRRSDMECRRLKLYFQTTTTSRGITILNILKDHEVMHRRGGWNGSFQKRIPNCWPMKTIQKKQYLVVSAKLKLMVLSKLVLS